LPDRACGTAKFSLPHLQLGRLLSSFLPAWTAEIAQKNPCAWSCWFSGERTSLPCLPLLPTREERASHSFAVSSFSSCPAASNTVGEFASRRETLVHRQPSTVHRLSDQTAAGRRRQRRPASPSLTVRSSFHSALLRFAFHSQSQRPGRARSSCASSKPSKPPTPPTNSCTARPLPTLPTVPAPPSTGHRFRWAGPCGVRVVQRVDIFAIVLSTPPRAAPASV
jgi:hypothetical protein